jgi:hypothetical protein
LEKKGNFNIYEKSSHSFIIIIIIELTYLDDKGDGTSQNSSIHTSRDSSPMNESSSSVNATKSPNDKSGSSTKKDKKSSKSATISGAASTQKQSKPDKPKKKSKLSFLSRKKKDSTTDKE